MNTPTLNTTAIAYQRRSVTTIMLHVVAALLPGIAVYALLIDSRLLVNLLLAVASALCFEAILIAMRRRPVIPCLKDTSIVVAAMLLVLSVPQSLPTWQLLFGVFILCTLGKHVFGGLGHNPFNPAMVAYAVLIISFPLTMTQWSTQLGFLDTHSSGTNNTEQPQQRDWNSVTSATPLDRLSSLKRETHDSSADSNAKIISDARTAGDSYANNISASDTAFFDVERPPVSALTISDNAAVSMLVLKSDWVWLSGAWLLGGLYLLFVRVISWHIPVTVLATLWILYSLADMGISTPTLSATVALLSGAIMFGAFFIATDPVSSASSNPGKLLYGTGIGILCFFIREFSAYPEGFAFAVLLMNMGVPLIDHAFTRNRFTKPPQHGNGGSAA